MARYRQSDPRRPGRKSLERVTQRAVATESSEQTETWGGVSFLNQALSRGIFRDAGRASLGQPRPPACLPQSLPQIKQEVGAAGRPRARTVRAITRTRGHRHSCPILQAGGCARPRFLPVTQNFAPRPSPAGRCRDGGSRDGGVGRQRSFTLRGRFPESQTLITRKHLHIAKQATAVPRTPVSEVSGACCSPARKHARCRTPDTRRERCCGFKHRARSPASESGPGCSVK